MLQPECHTIAWIFQVVDSDGATPPPRTWKVRVYLSWLRLRYESTCGSGCDSQVVARDGARLMQPSYFGILPIWSVVSARLYIFWVYISLAQCRWRLKEALHERSFRFRSQLQMGSEGLMKAGNGIWPITPWQGPTAVTEKWMSDLPPSVFPSKVSSLAFNVLSLTRAEEELTNIWVALSPESLAMHCLV
jgi:hypothetical protein